MPEITKLTIAPFTEGLDKETENWLLPNEAFVDMQNAFLRRGVLQKRPGYMQLATGGKGGAVVCQSRVVTAQIVVDDEAIGTTDGAGAANGTVGSPAVHVGTFTVTVAGTPAETFTDDGNGVLTGSIAGTGTITYATGAWTILGSNATGAVTASYTSSESLGNTDGLGAGSGTLSNTPVRPGIVVLVAGAVVETINDWGNGELYAAQTVGEVGGNTDGNGDASFILANIPVVSGSVEIDVGGGAATFSDDGYGLLISNDGTTASGTINYTSGAVTISNSEATSAILVDYYLRRGTIDYVTGDIAFTGSNATEAVTCVYSYYPKLPVMGSFNYIDSNEDRKLCVLDTRNFNEYNTTTNRLDYITHLSGTSYTGTNEDFWSFTNYVTVDLGPPVVRAPILVFTNGVDDVQYFDGTNTDDLKNNSNYKEPVASIGGNLQGAKLVFFFGERLVLLNVKQDGVWYPNRCLYTPVFNGIGSLSLDFTDKQAGVAEVSVSDEIMGADFLGSDLIVFLRDSVWSLKITTSRFIPFRWERLDVQGIARCDARFSVSSHYGEVNAAGKMGIISSDGNTVSRIDNKLPFFTQEDIEPELFKYCYSVETEKNRQRWMSYADKESSTETANKILVNGVEDNSWSIYTIPMHSFGNFYEVSSDKLWDDFTDPWDSYGDKWDSYTSFKDSLTVVGGDINGYVFKMDTEDNDDHTDIVGLSQASPAVVTVVNHRLSTGDVVKIRDVNGMTDINEEQSSVTVIDATSFELNGIDSTTFPAYTSGGFFEKAIAFDVTTKPINPWIKEDIKATLHWIDFRVDSSEVTTCNVQFFTDEREQPYIIADQVLDTIELEFSDETNRPYNWFRVYVNSTAQSHQIRLFQEQVDQMLRIHAVRFALSPAGSFEGGN